MIDSDDAVESDLSEIMQSTEAEEAKKLKPKLKQKLKQKLKPKLKQKLKPDRSSTSG